ncbi:MAG: phosphatase PAP2 family protein, partial [Chloroflexota bacterium]
LQATSHPLFDILATLFDFLGGDLGYLLILPLIFWSIDRKLGQWLLVVLVSALFLLIGGKELFGRPRPFQFDPEQVIVVVEASGFGFPSGHVGLSTAMWVFVALWAMRRWGFIVLAAYIPAMAWARMYAGVHYPQDVIGGFVIGLAVACGLFFNREWLARLWAGLPTAAQAAVIVISGGAMAVLLRGDDAGLSAAGILIGGGLGTMLAHRAGPFDSAGTLQQRTLRFVVGMLATLVVFVALDAAFEPLEPAAVFRVIRYALVTFVILGLYPVVMARTGFTQPV